MGTTNFHCLHLAFPSVEASIHVTIFVAKPITDFYFYFYFFTQNKKQLANTHEKGVMAKKHDDFKLLF